MPNPVKGLLEVYEDMVEVLLMLEIFLTENAYVEDLLYGTPSCSEACLFFLVITLPKRGNLQQCQNY